ncbi:STAS/SEC14 domain-containing protein [Rufibacter immobilis]|uniref:STAS/SEC14 domain-containing protein n=1 Tax=Rufibacter immobilis TaxID=1348778 RepID=UPI0035EE88C0
MIIFKNGFIELDYDPATDILWFEMPNVDDVVMPEMKRCLKVIVEHVRNYDVKRILLDARKTDILGGNEGYATIITEFYRDLMLTRVRRVARLVTPESIRENLVKRTLAKMNISFEVQAFTDTDSAMKWLKSTD